MRALRLGLKFLYEDGWSPHWQHDEGWCIHDALLEATGFCADQSDFDDYIDGLNRLSDELGEPVLDWEREPHRTEQDVIELFERVIDGEG